MRFRPNNPPHVLKQRVFGSKRHLLEQILCYGSDKTATLLGRIWSPLFVEDIAAFFLFCVICGYMPTVDKWCCHGNRFFVYIGLNWVIARYCCSTGQGFGVYPFAWPPPPYLPFPNGQVPSHSEPVQADMGKSTHTALMCGIIQVFIRVYLCVFIYCLFMCVHLFIVYYCFFLSISP